MTAFRVQCKDCPTLQEVERERDALKASLESLELTATMLATWAMEVFPEVNESGQVHFGRAMMEAAAETIRGAIVLKSPDLDGYPVIPQPDNKPDNVSDPLQAENVSDHTCGDCTLHQRSLPFDFCKMKIGSYFRRDVSEKACLSLSLRASVASEKEAI